MWDEAEIVDVTSSPLNTFCDDVMWSSMRENNCVQLLTILERRDGEAWSVSAVSEESMIPETTARRLLFPEVMEIRPYAWIVSLRSRVNLSDCRTAGEYTTTLVSSYYGRLLTTFTYLGVQNGMEYVQVNTSQFDVFERIGAKYDYRVTFDPRIGGTGPGPKGRARVRYEGPSSEGDWEGRLR